MDQQQTYGGQQAKPTPCTSW